MPFAVRIDHARSRLEIVGSDPVGLSDVLELFDRQIAEGAWTYAALHDAREVSWTPTADAIRAIVAFVDATSETLGPRGPVAIVTAPAAAIVTAWMYGRIGEGPACRTAVFRDIKAAARWLDNITARTQSPDV